MGIASASMLIVGLMVALMMTGMPLGIVTLIVSILSALFYFGYGELYVWFRQTRLDCWRNIR